MSSFAREDALVSLGILPDPDDAPGTVDLQSTANGVDEHGGLPAVLLRLDLPAGTLAVPIDGAAAPTDTASAGQDYSGVPAVVRFPAGSGDGATLPVPLDVVGDRELEGDETVELVLAGLTGSPASAAPPHRDEPRRQGRLAAAGTRARDGAGRPSPGRDVPTPASSGCSRG